MYWQVRIATVPEPNEATIPIGRSKFCGWPDLPESWLPNFNTEEGLEIPQLLLQLNLEDIPDEFHVKRLLPRRGIFFVLVDDDHKNPSCSARLHFYTPNANEKLTRTRPVGTNPNKERYIHPPCRAEFKQILTIGNARHQLPLFDLTEQEDAALEKVTKLLRERYGKHALLGLSTPFQRTYEACLATYCDDINLRSLPTPAQATKNGILWREVEWPYDNYHSEHITCSRDHPHQCQDRLLLELETDQTWMFGDDGLMEVTIHQRDLNAHRFDRIRHHFDWH